MKWFAVKCIYQVVCGEGKHSPQFNEQTRLIRAINLSLALQKANEHAEYYNKSFANCHGDLVVWKFIGIDAAVEIKAPADGVEVNSKILEPTSVQVYLEKLKHRTKLLTETNQLHFDN